MLQVTSWLCLKAISESKVCCQNQQCYVSMSYLSPIIHVFVGSIACLMNGKRISFVKKHLLARDNSLSSLDKIALGLHNNVQITSVNEALAVVF